METSSVTGFCASNTHIDRRMPADIAGRARNTCTRWASSEEEMVSQPVRRGKVVGLEGITNGSST